MFVIDCRNLLGTVKLEYGSLCTRRIAAGTTAQLAHTHATLYMYVCSYTHIYIYMYTSTLWRCVYFIFTQIYVYGSSRNVAWWQLSRVTRRARRTKNRYKYVTRRTTRGIF